MEFLDDLLSSQEPEEEEATEKPDRAEAPLAEERAPSLADEKAWESLRSHVAKEVTRQEHEEPPPKRSGLLSSLTALQKVILIALTLAVLTAWGVALPRILSASKARRTESAAALTSPTVAPTVPPTEHVTPAQTTATSTPTVLPTPTEEPPVHTRFDTQIALDPNNPDLYLRRGREYLRVGAYDVAIQDFSKVLRLDPSCADGYAGLGWAYFYTWAWKASQEAFENALAINPDLIEAYFGLGKLYFYQGMYVKAAKAFDQAAAINPQDAEAEAWLAIASAKFNDVEEALGAVERAKAQNDQLPIVYIAQSWARRIQTPPDIDGAQADLLYAQDLGPTSFETFNALAEFYTDWRPERLAEAERLAIYAYEWATNDIERAIALYTLGRVYLAMDRQEDALQALQEAAAMATDENGEVLLAGLAADLARAQP